MGWTWHQADHYKSNGDVDRKTECDLKIVKYPEYYELLKSAMVGSTYYAAVKSVESDEVFAAVILTKTNKQDYYNFGYKEMDETMCPMECNCPEGILDLLSPTDNQWANEWREKCRQSAKDKQIRQKFMKMLKDIEVGGQISFVLTKPVNSGLNVGNKIVLNKIIHGNKMIWFDGMYKWPTTLIADVSGMNIVEE